MTSLGLIKKKAFSDAFSEDSSEHSGHEKVFLGSGEEESFSETSLSSMEKMDSPKFDKAQSRFAIGKRNEQASDESNDGTIESSAISLMDKIPGQLRKHFFFANRKIRCKYCRSCFQMTSKLASKVELHIKTKHPKLRAMIGREKKPYDKSVKPKYLQRISGVSPLQQNDEQFFLVKGRRSYVWAHFIYNQNAKEAICRHCEVRYNVKDGSTSGMLRHMDMEHPELIPKEGISKSSRLGKPRGAYRKKRELEEKLKRLGTNPRMIREILKKKLNERNAIIESEIVNQECKSQQNLEEQENLPSSNECPRLQLKNLESQILHNYPPHLSSFELAQEISELYDEKFEVVQAEVERNHWSRQRRLEVMVEKLEKIQGINIVKAFGQDEEENQILAGFAIMYSDYFEDHGESVMIVHRPCKDLHMLGSKEQGDEMIKSVQYLFSQGSCAEPVPFGLLISRNEQVAISQIMPKIFGRNSALVILIVSDSVQPVLKSYFKGKAPVLEVKYGQDLCASHISKQIESRFAQNKKRRSGHWLGFFSSIAFLQSVRKITTFNVYRPATINCFLLDFFRKNHYLSEEGKKANLSLPEQIDSLSTMKKEHPFLFYEPISSDWELRELMRVLSFNIFIKLYVRYLIARFYFRIAQKVRVGNKLECYVQNRCVAFHLESNCWECECGDIVLTGLPCEHLMRVVLDFEGSIRYYVNSRWVTQQKNLNDIDLIEGIEGISIAIQSRQASRLNSLRELEKLK